MLRAGTPRLCAGLLLLTAAAYLPLWRNDFVDFDDLSYITNNPRVMGGLTRSGFAWAWSNPESRYPMPLAWLSLQLDAQVFAARPPGGSPELPAAVVHGENLLWHAASVLLLFGLCRRLTGAPGRSFLVAALFAVHPMHVESVAWAAERKDVLSVFFGLLALWAYARYAETPGWKWYLGTAAAFLLSLLSKPMLMTLPFVLLLLDYWPLRRLSSPAGLGRLLLEKVPLFALAGGAAVATLAARARTGSMVPLGVIPLSARLGNAGSAYGWYLGSTVWPSRLAVLYPHPYRNWSALSAAVGAGLLLAVTALCLWQARRRPWLVTGWLWFVGSLVPVIGLAQGGAQAWADRFSYWPHIGLFLALVWGMAELAERFRTPDALSTAAGALTVGALAVATWIQVGYWRDTVTLWERALAVTQDNHAAHMNLGRYDLSRGRLDTALSHLAEAVRLDPNLPDSRYALGVALLCQGRDGEAAGHFKEALRWAPSHADAWHNLAVARLRQGEWAAAVRCFGRVLELQPDSADARAGLGLALCRAGRREEAVAAFEMALERDPRQADAWHGLGLVHLAAGRPDRAAEVFARALQYKPQMATAATDLGMALGRDGRWDQAVSWHLTALQLHQEAEAQRGRAGPAPAGAPVPPFVVCLCRLGFALHHVGDQQAAAAAYRTALERDPGWPAKFTAQAQELLTNPDVALRDARLACELVLQATQAVDDPPAATLDALAAAQAALGQSAEAVRTAEDALKKAEAAAQTSLTAAIRERLRRYRHGESLTSEAPVPADRRR
jgi:tetratricopeptide (TPR) repeat protein